MAGPSVNRLACKMERTVQLHYPIWLVLLSAALILAPISAAWLVWAGEQPTAWWYQGLPWLALIFWLWLSYHVFLVDLGYSEEGITSISPLLGSVHIAWSEIDDLSYMGSIDGYVLQANDGRRIKFNDWRIGSDRLIVLVLVKLGLVTIEGVGSDSDQPLE